MSKTNPTVELLSIVVTFIVLELQAYTVILNHKHTLTFTLCFFFFLPQNYHHHNIHLNEELNLVKSLKSPGKIFLSSLSVSLLLH